MKKLISLFLLITLFSYTMSEDIKGTGYATNADDARKEALLELTKEFTSSLENSFIKDKDLARVEGVSAINLLFEERIDGIKYKEKKYFLRKKYRSIATLPEENMPLYEDLAVSYKERIYSNIQDSEAAEVFLTKKELVQKALTNYTYYEAYKTIAQSLGSTYNYNINYTRPSIEGRLAKIDSVLNKPKTLFVTLTGDFPSEGYAYIMTKVTNLVSNISENSKSKLVILKEDNSDVNTLFNVNVNSYYIDMNEPVTYNNKVITPEKHVAELNITISARDKTTGEFIVNKTADAKSYDFNSRKSAMYKAVDIVFKEEEENLKNAFAY